MDTLSLLSLLKGLGPVWRLLEPSAMDVIVDSTVFRLRGDAIASGFDDLDELRASLGRWANDELPGLIEKVQTGEELRVEDVEASLCTTNLDKYQVDGWDAAEALILSLRRQMFSSKEGTFLLSQQMATASSDVLEEVRGVNDRLDALTSALPLGSASAEPLDADPSVEGDESPPSTDKVRIETRLAIAKDMLDAGRPKTALGLLDSILEGDKSKLWPRARFRGLLNSAVATMQLEDYESASRRLAAAKALYPDDAGLRANEIFLLVSTNDIEAALKCARLELEKGLRREVLPAVMSAFAAAGIPEEILDRIPPEDELNASELMSLANLFAQRGDLGEGVRLADKAAAMMPMSSRAHQLRGSLRLTLAQRLGRENESEGSIPTGLIEEAKDALTEAVRLAEEGEAAGSLSDARLNLGAALLGLGQYEDAVSASDKVLAFREEPIARLNRGLANFRLSHFELAIADLGIAFETHPAETVLPLVLSLEECSRSAEALPFLADAWKEVADALVLAQICDLTMQLKSKGMESDLTVRVEAYLNEQLESGDIAARIIVGRYKAMSDDHDGARAVLDEIDPTAELEAGSHPLNLLDAASIYYAMGDYSKAAVLAGKAVERVKHHAAWELSVVSQYRAGRRREAYEAAKAYRVEYGVDETVARIEAASLVRMGKSAEAAEVYQAMYEATGEVAWALNASGYWLSSDNLDKAVDSLVGIDLLALDVDAATQMQAAALAQALGRPEALELAYRAARRAPNDPEILAAYPSVFLAISQADEHSFEVEAIAPGTAARLAIGDREHWRLVVDTNEPAIGPMDVDPNSELGVALIGRTAGETLVIGLAERATPVEVLEVQSKYVRLFQEVFTEFGQRFPTDGSIQALSVGENDFSELHEILGRQHRAMVDAVALVNDKGLPASAFARMTGIGIFESTHSLIHDAKVNTRMSDLSLVNSAALPDGSSLVFDISSLITLQKLGLLSDVPELAGRCVVASQVQDELNAAAKRLDERATSTTLAGDGEHLVMTEAEQHAEALRDVRAELGEILDFIEDACEVETSPNILDFESEETVASKMMGTPSLATALLARDINGVAVSDDAGMRVLSQVEVKADTCDTVSVMKRLVAEGLMSGEGVLAAIETLEMMGFTALPIDKDFVMGALGDRGMGVNPGLRALIRSSIGAAPLSADEVVDLAASVMSTVCFEEPNGLSSGGLLDAALEGLRRRGDAVTRKALDEARRRLILAPFQWTRLKDYAKLWYAVRGFESPLS